MSDCDKRSCFKFFWEGGPILCIYMYFALLYLFFHQPSLLPNIKAFFRGAEDHPLEQILKDDNFLSLICFLRGSVLQSNKIISTTGHCENVHPDKRAS